MLKGLASPVRPPSEWRNDMPMLVTVLPLIGLTWKRFKPLASATLGPSHEDASSLTLRAAVRTRNFWLLAAGMLIVVGVVSSIIIHGHPLLTDRGLTIADATCVMSLLGIALLIGRLTTGWLLDRFTARQMIWIAFLFPAIACFIFATYAGSLPLAIIAVACVGIAAGIEGDMLAYFTSRYFGVRHYGQIYGVLLGLFSVGYGVFAPIAGFLHAASGSYALAFSFSGIALLIGAVLLYFIGDYPAARDPSRTL